MLKIFTLLVIVASAYAGRSPHGYNYLKTLSDEEIGLLPAAIVEDALLNCSQLIEKYGYPAEVHEVETEDGYLLTVHRIPGGKLDGKKQRNVKAKTPVFLMHGLMSSSVDWIINGPEKALGYILADEGYDVWMGNARGTYYSKKHVTLDPKDNEFWKFSWNEIGYYDLPAMIDYALKTTGQEKLHYIGHSQGGTTFFVMASEKPEMNDKIISMQGLAPAAYITNAKSPFITALAPYIYDIEKVFELVGLNEFLPNTPLQRYLVSILCTEESKYSPICSNILFILCGFNPDQLNTTMLPVYMAHTPAGASSRQVIHYGQEIVSGRFRKYDHGPEKNMEIYGSIEPPDYDLSKIVAPVAIHYSDNDWLVVPEDVDRLNSELGNSIGKFRVPMAEFNHLDYIWAIDAPTLLYDTVLEKMRQFNK